MGKYWANIGKILGKYWANIGQILGENWAKIGQILGEYWANIEQILGDIGQILARLHTTRIVTMYQGPRITDSTQL